MGPCITIRIRASAASPVHLSVQWSDSSKRSDARTPFFPLPYVLLVPCWPVTSPITEISWSVGPTRRFLRHRRATLCLLYFQAHGVLPGEVLSSFGISSVIVIDKRSYRGTNARLNVRILLDVSVLVVSWSYQKIPDRPTLLLIKRELKFELTVEIANRAS